MKQFSLAQILTVTTRKLLTEDIGGLYEILSYMTGEDVWTHQLPRFSDECALYLHEQFPFTKTIDAFNVTPSNWQEWIAEQNATHGEYHMVRPIHFEDHAVIDPIDEMRQMNPNIEIITIEQSVEQNISPYGDINWKVDDESDGGAA